MVFRIGGMASGLDTNTMIEQLMSIERQPQTLMSRNKQLLDWRKGYWSDVNTKLLAVKTSVGGLLDRDKLLAKKVTSSDDKYITATANEKAAAGTYTVNVTALATETQIRSGNGALNIGLGGKVVVTQPVNTDASKLGTKITSGYFTVNGVKITVADGDYIGTGNTADPKDLLGKINGSAAGVTATYDAATDKMTLTATAPGGNLNLGAVGDTSNFLSATALLAATRSGDSKTSTLHLGRIDPDQYLNLANFQTAVTDDGTGKGAFKINGVEITYNAATDTLSKVISRINNSTANVTATYDATTDSLLLRSKTTGSVSILLEQEAGKGNFLSALNLTTAAGGTQTLGTNASFTIAGFNNGQPIVSTTNSVSDVIPGVTLNLKDETTSAVTVTVAPDLEASKGTVKEFVSKLNEALSYINEKLGEKRVFKDWDKMTDYERRQGLLKGDSVLTGIRSRLMAIATDRIEGFPPEMDSLSDIGITTKVDLSSGGGTGGTTLVIDETKLEAALRDKPDMVMNLLFSDTNGNGTWDKDATTEEPTEKGIAVQLDYYLNQLTDTRTKLFGERSEKLGTVPRQQDVLSRDMEYIQDRIDDFERRMTQREQQLIRQFTAMEQVIAQVQSQSSWLAGQLAKLG